MSPRLAPIAVLLLACHTGADAGEDSAILRCDSGSADWSTWYADADGDTFGDPSSAREGCAAGLGETLVGGDCDDHDAQVNPEEEEVCASGIDEDCDGVDAGCGPERTVVLGGQSVRLYGSAGRGLGAHLAAGDLDGDGSADVVATTGEDDFAACGGTVAFGALSGAENVDDVGVRLTPEDVPCTSAARVAIGDMDGDGTPDVALGRMNVADKYQYGSVWVGFGPFARSGENSGEAVYEGAAGDGFGQTVDVADVTGDGVAELLTAAGRACDQGVLVTQSALAEEYPFWIRTSFMDCFYDMSIAGGGDVDGDGLGDVVGAFGTEVYLMAGGSVGELTTADLAGHYLVEEGGHSHGAALALADLDDDGLADVVVRPAGSGGSGTFGDTYVVFGPASGATDLGGAEVIVRGSERGDFRPVSVGAEDADGDGVADLLLGAEHDGAPASLYLGPFAAGTYANGADLAVVAPSGETDTWLSSTAMADLDGDGLRDFLLGSPRGDEGGSDGGVMYVVPVW